MTGRDDVGWDEARGLPEGDEISARLAVSPDPVEPDPALRDRVLARIAGIERGRRGERRRRGRNLAAAAALVLLSWGLTYGWMSAAPAPEPAGDPEIEQVRAAVAEAEARAEEFEEMLAEQDDELEELGGSLDAAREALSVLTAEQVERLDLAATAPGGLEATARVYWDWDAYSCYFVADGLPAAGGGRAYVLWLYTDTGETLRAGSLEPGSPSFYAVLPQDMGKVVRAVLTEEPDPPGDAPTGVALLAGGGTEPDASG